MADPTNARQRTLNSFFDSPRFAIKALPEIPDEPVATAAPAAVAPAVVAAPPTLKLALEPAAKRTLTAFLEHGLLITVAADRPLADVDARLFEALADGTLRPLGAAFKVAPTPAGAHLRIDATRFARSRLRRAGTGSRSVQLQLTGTDRNGIVGKLRSSFHLR
jgi:hypothetical protein